MWLGIARVKLQPTMPQVYSALRTQLRLRSFAGQLFEDFTSTDGRMVTISGVNSVVVRQVLAELSAQGQQVYLAAQNAPRHTTIVGGETAVLNAEGIAIQG